MPAQYRPYVYLIEDDGADGICEALKKVFSLSLEERTEKGKRARAFVLREKTNKIQAKKLLDFLERELP